MRLRKVKNAYDKLLAGDKYFIPNPSDFKGKWLSVFNNNNPIHIEIGCGKGQFILELAKRNSNINYIAIEKYDSVLLRALEKVIDEDVFNLKLLMIDANKISDYFDTNEVNRIYLNFSDPWPKNAHAKRRLTASTFLAQYENILDKTGELHQKTDNRFLFESSLESFNENGWSLKNISLDLHKDNEKYPDNIMTEFEEKWSKLGPIYRLEAYKRK